MLYQKNNFIAKLSENKFHERQKAPDFLLSLIVQDVNVIQNKSLIFDLYPGESLLQDYVIQYFTN